MGEIGLKEMQEALQRWKEFDFLQVAAPVFRAIMESEGHPEDAIHQFFDDQGDEGEEAQEALRSSVDLSPEASAAFIRSMPALLRAETDPELAKYMGYAALVGLVVGLTAKQLADES